MLRIYMKKLLIILFLITVLISACATQKVSEPTQPSEQKAAEVKQAPSSITINFDGGLPTHIKLGDSLSLRWKANSNIPYNTESTSIRFGFEKIEDSALTSSSYPFSSASYVSEIPKTFEATIYPKQSGPMRVRANAKVNGVDYWTEEKTVNVD